METTRFDLNQSIRQWRDPLAQSATLRTEELDELEHHLRDSIAELRARQLTEEESFLIATRRLGHRDTLVQEYAKTNSGRVWASRLAWMLAGVFVVRLFGTSPSVLWRWAPQEINAHWLGFLVVLFRWAILFAPLLGFVWLTIRKPQLLPRWAGRALRRPVRTSLGLILFTVIASWLTLFPALALMLGHRPAFSPDDMARVQVVSLWQMVGNNAEIIVLLPIALVWLARRAQMPRLAK